MAIANLSRLVSRPIAHRGLHGCGDDGPVENSLGAASAAVIEAYGIECDVQLSRDGEAMVFHDSELDRLTGRRGAVIDIDAAELRRLPLRGGPECIPTLADLLHLIAGRVPLVIEIKTAWDGDLRLADRTLDILESYAGPAAVESFDPQIVLRCRNRTKVHPVGLVGPPDMPRQFDPAALAVCDFLSWSIDQIGEAARLHPALPRTTWTVRSSAQRAIAARYDAQIVFEGLQPLP